jgi:hypothetical protein
MCKFLRRAACRTLANSCFDDKSLFNVLYSRETSRQAYQLFNSKGLAQ